MPSIGADFGGNENGKNLSGGRRWIFHWIQRAFKGNGH